MDPDAEWSGVPGDNFPDDTFAGSCAYVGWALDRAFYELARPMLPALRWIVQGMARAEPDPA